MIAVVAALLLPAAAPAQPHCSEDADTSNAALARRFAPVLRFAPSEPYFPTVPFFYAFDGIDNDGDGLTDFEDPDEIAALSAEDSTYASWGILDARYARQLERLSPDPEELPPVAPLPAVLYRVRPITEEERNAVRRFLKKDILAWDRTAEHSWRGLGFEVEEFKVIEYWFYYVRDMGLVGHPLDIEFVFVFVPNNPRLACEMRLVVGAGHTDRVPNNVLVLSNEPVMGRADLARRDTLTGVITELGGHSSAPDLPPDGTFTLGVDVNWFTTKAWGTRDVQSLAQMGYGGAYRPDMTLPRDSTFHPLILRPRGTLEPGHRGQEYSLIPASLFEELDRHLPVHSQHLTPQQWGATTDTVSALLASIADALGDDPLIGLDQLDSTGVRRMAAWNQPMLASRDLPEGGVISTGRMHVWEHSHYTGSTDLILKSHLFPPSVKSIEKPVDVLRLISWGVSTWPGTGSQIEAGFVLPWIKFPIEIRGFLELQAGLGTSPDFDASEFTLGLTYFSSYFQRVSWYSTSSWIPDPVVTGANFTISGGPSLLLWMKPNKTLLGPINILRLSTGPRFRLSGEGSSGVDWEFAFSFRQ
jgi:hypothetical protein